MLLLEMTLHYLVLTPILIDKELKQMLQLLSFD